MIRGKYYSQIWIIMSKLSSMYIASFCEWIEKKTALAVSFREMLNFIINIVMKIIEPKNKIEFL